MGGVVLLVAALFVYFAHQTAQVRSPPGYPVRASFGKIGGLAVGSDVRISGVKVGSVAARALDPQTYAAIVTMTIDDGVALPEDTIASIANEGPLGGRYVRLEPGTSATALTPGGVIKQTRGYRSLEDQVGEIIFLATGKAGKSIDSGD
jgi:phospholipid/cholesterol/gamma-HCH transport system substrate-binding protein